MLFNRKKKKKLQQLFESYELLVTYNLNENARNVPQLSNIPNWILFLHFYYFNVVLPTNF